MSKLTTEQCPVTYQHLGHDWRSPTTWARCPGIRIDPNTRAQPVHTRRHVLAELRSVLGLLRLRVSRWDVTGIELDGMRHVPRRVDEFPENSPEAWAQLARTCRDTAADLHTLATYAEQRAAEVHRFNKREAAKLKGGES